MKRYQIIGVRRREGEPDNPQVVRLWRDSMTGDDSASAAKFDLLAQGFARVSIFTTYEAQVESLDEDLPRGESC